MANSDFNTWYENNYHLLTGHGVWLHGGELNTIGNEEWQKRQLHVLWTRLSSYFDVGHSFTHQLLYQITVGHPHFFADLAYLPPRLDAPHFDKAQVPWMLGTQTKLGALAFDLVGVSLSIVQELINLPTMLEKSGFPLISSERLARADVPIILLGGASAQFSSILWTKDSLVDAIFVGEREKDILRLLSIAHESKLKNRSKRETLKLFEEVPGCFLPDNLRPVRRSINRNLDEAALPGASPVMFLDEQLGSAHLPISEGCPCFCSFCAESWDRKPYRERTHKKLLEQSLQLKAKMAASDLEIFSANFNMHRQIGDVLVDLSQLFHHLGLKSQRLDILAHDPELLAIERALGKSSITIGLEGISERLRHYLHKNLSNEQLSRGLEAIFRLTPRELKIFLILTGIEEKDDLTAFGDWLKRLKEIRQRQRSNARIILSLTALVRFPGTPLEFADALSPQQLRPLVEKLQQLAKAQGCEFRLAAPLSEYWVSQILVRAKDPRVGRAFLQTIRQRNFLYYQEIDEDFAQAFRQTLLAEGVDIKQLLQATENLEEVPWAKIDAGVSREFLRRRFDLSQNFTEEEYCLGRHWSEPGCQGCEACSSPQEIAQLIAAPSSRTRSLACEEITATIKQRAQQEFGISFLVERLPPLRGLPIGVQALAVARALMCTVPSLIPLYVRPQKPQGIFSEDGACFIEGQTAVSLLWLAPAKSIIQEALANTALRQQIDQLLLPHLRLLGIIETPIFNTRLSIYSPFVFAPDNYFRLRQIKATRRRLNDHEYCFEIHPSSRKKGIIEELKYQDLQEGAAQVELVTGPKFSYQDFVQGCFRFQEASQWVRLRCLMNSEPTFPQMV